MLTFNVRGRGFESHQPHQRRGGRDDARYIFFIRPARLCFLRAIHAQGKEKRVKGKFYADIAKLLDKCLFTTYIDACRAGESLAAGGIVALKIEAESGKIGLKEQLNRYLLFVYWRREGEST